MLASQNQRAPHFLCCFLSPADPPLWIWGLFTSFWFGFVGFFSFKIVFWISFSNSDCFSNLAQTSPPMKKGIVTCLSRGGWELVKDQCQQGALAVLCYRTHSLESQRMWAVAAHVVRLCNALCETGLGSTISPPVLPFPACCVCLTPCSPLLTQQGEQCKPHHCHDSQLKAILGMCVWQGFQPGSFQ